MISTFSEQLEVFWRSAKGKSPQTLREELDELLAQRPAGDAVVLFERASLHDYLGEEAQAVEPYRAAIATGLEPDKLDEARIQLASTLRNLGEAGQAVELLQLIQTPSHVYRDAQAFLALALYDAGEPQQALRVALQTLAPTLSLYGRPVRDYAKELAGTS
ncbi:tetratricopeptide repeat protein [Arthrobacter sp. MYb213]|uniref:tetratricopeptide repeat protein n=1 Tax=Arthrobacter sp. MYb213 TaxID=1848595 RepID=UPI000CFD1A5E|nr:tetratricopeptide repeat protein [Arthrobacter sp. MYb213]PRB68797.1 hypothetical protein CQ011_13810 [Arthrobacter sp. MYb213]